MFQPFEPHGRGGPRIREIPLRMVLPNLITVLAICAGLSGIRLAFEGRFEAAVVMVLLAAFLDGIDGRLARMLKATSKFGAQMDSLADIVNFGVAPALVLYAYLLDRAGSPGWIAALLFRHRLRPAAGALQRARRGCRAAGLAGRVLRRGACTGRRRHRAAADLSDLRRRAGAQPFHGVRSERLQPC